MERFLNRSTDIISSNLCTLLSQIFIVGMFDVIDGNKIINDVQVAEISGSVTPAFILQKKVRYNLESAGGHKKISRNLIN